MVRLQVLSLLASFLQQSKSIGAMVIPRPSSRVSTAATPRLHYKWPSMANIHRVLDDPEFRMEDFTSVLVSEKLDGSNLGIQVNAEDGSLLAIHGRNALLWHCRKQNNQNPFHLTYGTVKGNFEPLQNVMEPLQETVRCLLKTQEGVVPTNDQTNSFLFFGEWFNPTTQENPTWHPFGVSVIQKDSSRKTYSMTTDLHKVFVSCGLSPPKILHRASDLAEAIEAAFPQMIEAQEGFEGVVLTLDSNDCGNPDAKIFGLGCKWKAAAYEEQPQFPLDSKANTKELQLTIDLLKQVYDQRQAHQAAKKSIKKKKNEQRRQDPLRPQVMLAFNAVMSKSPLSSEEIRQLEDKDSQRAELKRVSQEVLQDLEDQYKQTKMELPKEVRKLSGKIISQQIMNPPN